MKKIFQARELIKKSDLKKAGRNEFSKYSYYTPEQVSELVNKACAEVKIIPIFSLKKNEYGVYGELNIWDIESETMILTTVMSTEMPVITATNATQQMGGCMTYTNRYMLMSLFDIVDNNLDFDSQDNSKTKTTYTKDYTKEPEQSKTSYGKCPKCGADNVKSPKTQKIFCSQKCWLK